MDKTALLWFEYASHDLEAARLMAGYYPQRRFGEIICFHCQQSVEKYFKAYLIAVNEIPEESVPKTHDLQLLRKMCENHNPSFSQPEIYKICDILVQYGIRARYPKGVEILGSDITRALRAAKFVMQFPPIAGAYKELREAEEDAEEENNEDEYEHEV